MNNEPLARRPRWLDTHPVKPAPAGTDWHIDRLVKVTDGDTVRVTRSRTLDVIDGIEISAHDTHGVAIRLVNLDTPERGQPGYLEARGDLVAWLMLWGDALRVITYPGGGFDRLLGDIYVGNDPSHTATQYMLRDRGWPAYVDHR